MKNLKFLFLIGLMISTGCQSSKLAEGVEIVSANYQIITSGPFEKGYAFRMETHALPEGTSIKGIIINHRLFEGIKIEPKGKSTNLIINQYLAVESRKIRDFRDPPADARRDGIVFEKDGKEIYMYYPFQLIE